MNTGEQQFTCVAGDGAPLAVRGSSKAGEASAHPSGAGAGAGTGAGAGAGSGAGSDGGGASTSKPAAGGKGSTSVGVHGSVHDKLCGHVLVDEDVEALAPPELWARLQRHREQRHDATVTHCPKCDTTNRRTGYSPLLTCTQYSAGALVSPLPCQYTAFAHT